MSYDGRWETIRLAVDNGIAWLELHRPEKRNAMNPLLNREMIEGARGARRGRRAGVVVLTGAGDSFSAGMDLKSTSARSTTPRATSSARCVVTRRLADPDAALLREADDRDGQRLVLRRRVHPARGVRPRGRRRRGDLRRVGDQLGDPPWSVVSRALAETISARDALLYIMTGARSTAAGLPRWPRQLEHPAGAPARGGEELARELLGKNPTPCTRRRSASACAAR